MPQLGSNRAGKAPSTSQQAGVRGAITRFWQRSYAPDYLGFALLYGAYMLIAFFVEPFHRMFSLDDISIQYPHALVQRVPPEMNVIYAFVIPLAILILWSLIFRPGLHKAHVTILGLFISLILTTFLTDVIKNAVGRPRPDLIDRCKPMKGTPEHTLVTIAVCTETDHHTLHDGWRSFPSGHSSFAFAGLGYLAIFFSGQMHVFRPRTDLARVLLALAPLVGAAMIAMSRMADYRHDVYDVTVGSLLGISVAYFSYRRYYPSLKRPRCHELFPSRAEVALSGGLGKARDEEQQISSAEEFDLGELEDDEAERLPLNETRPERGDGRGSERDMG